jgi:hypothetical protein
MDAGETPRGVGLVAFECLQRHLPTKIPAVNRSCAGLSDRRFARTPVACLTRPGDRRAVVPAGRSPGSRNKSSLSDGAVYQTGRHAPQGSTVPPKFTGATAAEHPLRGCSAPENFGSPVARLRRRCAALTRSDRLIPEGMSSIKETVNRGDTEPWTSISKSPSSPPNCRARASRRQSGQQPSVSSTSSSVTSNSQKWRQSTAATVRPRRCSSTNGVSSKALSSSRSETSPAPVRPEPVSAIHTSCAASFHSVSQNERATFYLANDCTAVIRSAAWLHSHRQYVGRFDGRRSTPGWPVSRAVPSKFISRHAIGLCRGAAGHRGRLRIRLRGAGNATNGRQGKSTACGLVQVVGWIELFRRHAKWLCWRFLAQCQRIQRFNRHRHRFELRCRP